MEILVNGEPGPADRAGFIEALGEQWNGFPDVNAAEVHRLVRGDQVITEMIIEGHNAAEFLGRRATGKLWRVAVAWVCRVADGRVASLRVYVDNTPLQAAVRVGERLATSTALASRPAVWPWRRSAWAVSAWRQPCWTPSY